MNVQELFTIEEFIDNAHKSDEDFIAWVRMKAETQAYKDNVMGIVKKGMLGVYEDVGLDPLTSEVQLSRFLDEVGDIVWAHAVNTIVESALKNRKVMMYE